VSTLGHGGGRPRARLVWLLGLSHLASLSRVRRVADTRLSPAFCAVCQWTPMLEAIHPAATQEVLMIRIVEFVFATLNRLDRRSSGRAGAPSSLTSG